MRGLAAIAVAAAAITTAPAQAQPPALLLENGRVWTNDASSPSARSILIRGERIAAIDPAPGEVPGDVRRIDLGGRRVVPGFNDAHTHVFEGGFGLLAPDLLESDTPEAFVAKLASYAETLPEGRWIDLPAAWDHERWPGGELPSKALIDPVTPENPVWIRRPDGHVGLANSLALERAGITAETPDPSGGRIDRDPETGEPTGILRDAGGLVRRVIPPTSEAEYREALDAALAHAAELGVTTIQDMCYEAGGLGIRLLQEYAREGTLTARFFCRTALSGWEHPAAIGVTAAYGDRWVRQGSLKSYADGAIGSSTAYFFDDYDSEPGYRGLLNDVMQPPERFLALARAADSVRLQLSIHAIGDAAISLVLDQFEAIAEANEAWDRRWRIEHAQHMAAKDFARMAELGVIASVQPSHVIDDGRFVERKIGSDRASRTYPFRSFLDAGVTMAFGTDWPVAPLDPMRTVFGALTRIVPEVHPEGWIPEQRIGVEEALVAYTSGSAYAEFSDHEKGRLKAGYLADLVVLSDDPFEVEPERLESIRSVLTVVGGRVVHAAGPFGASGRP